MKDKIPIYSSDGGNVALLRNGRVFQIGELVDGLFVIGCKGNLMPCCALVWRFFQDGDEDHIYFNDKGQLLFASICTSRPDYLVKIYSYLMKKRASLETWFNVVRGEFIITELGF